MSAPNTKSLEKAEKLTKIRSDVLLEPDKFITEFQIDQEVRKQYAIHKGKQIYIASDRNLVENLLKADEIAFGKDKTRCEPFQCDFNAHLSNDSV